MKTTRLSKPSYLMTLCGLLTFSTLHVASGSVTISSVWRRSEATGASFNYNTPIATVVSVPSSSWTQEAGTNGDFVASSPVSTTRGLATWTGIDFFGGPIFGQAESGRPRAASAAQETSISSTGIQLTQFHTSAFESGGGPATANGSAASAANSLSVTFTVDVPTLYALSGRAREGSNAFGSTGRLSLVEGGSVVHEFSVNPTNQSVFGFLPWEDFQFSGTLQPGKTYQFFANVDSRIEAPLSQSYSQMEASLNFTPVPESSSAAMGLVGLGMLVWRRRR